MWSLEELCVSAQFCPYPEPDQCVSLLSLGGRLVSWILASSDVDDAIVDLRIDVRFQPVRSGRFLHT